MPRWRGEVILRASRSRATAAKSSKASWRFSRSTRLVPGRAELAAAADVGDHIGAAALQPDLAHLRDVDRRLGDFEAAVAVHDGRDRAVELRSPSDGPRSRGSWSRPTRSPRTGRPGASRRRSGPAGSSPGRGLPVAPSASQRLEGDRKPSAPRRTAGRSCRRSRSWSRVASFGRASAARSTCRP